MPTASQGAELGNTTLHIYREKTGGATRHLTRSRFSHTNLIMTLVYLGVLVLCECDW